jgi:uncharacterized protein (DUF305 family)
MSRMVGSGMARLALLLLVTLQSIAACASRGTVPATAGQVVAADAAFMRDMIAHHAQALEMTALVPDRAAREDVRQLARRIEASQRDEIALMRRWLAARGQPVPDSPAGHESPAGHRGMPGMLDTHQLARLAQSSGESFDRLFLESMLVHHEGALVMVARLFATEGAGQDIELFQFASAIDADQRAEIARMRRMLESGSWRSAFKAVLDKE